MGLTRIIGPSLLACVSLTATATFAMDRQMEIVNETGFEIVAFFSHRKGEELWSDNMIPESPIGGEDSRMLSFEDGSGYCMYSFKVVFDDGEELISEDINICDLPSFTYY